MDRETDDRTISLKLSEALCEIGVSEAMMRERRKCSLLNESVDNMKYVFTDELYKIHLYHYGSQSEGSTTIGLNSDVDRVISFGCPHVIQDWADWKPGVPNLLMVQDETTSPGYCVLQLLRNDSPQAETQILNGWCRKDNNGRILHKNNVFNLSIEGIHVNGPAHSMRGSPGIKDRDFVLAFHCDRWPIDANEWLNRAGSWPSSDIKNLAKTSGCLVVPVGSKCNNLIDVEWRISTSSAERLLMFDLNITQMRCYVLLKIISKTFFTINGESIITSFMCKCTLFHCIETTPQSYWREDNLYPCVMNCILILHDRVRNLNCPHYIMLTNNLMSQRINPDQQRKLLNALQSLINLNIDMLFAIDIDGIGKRLQIKLTNALHVRPHLLLSQSAAEMLIVFNAYLGKSQHTIGVINQMLDVQQIHGISGIATKLLQGIRRLKRQYSTLTDMEVEACKSVAPLLCSWVGSILASFSVYTNNTVSPEALWWFSKGRHSDVSFSRLKLASAFYCAGDIRKAKLILEELEGKYSNMVIPMCSCYWFVMEPLDERVAIHVYRNRASIQDIIACCLQFLRCEASIIPQELTHELFRSTESEIQTRSEIDKRWMNLAVVDSLPYFYFLQYKVYRHLGSRQEQRKALSNLLKTALNELNLAHRETAWNLLGQCMEQESLPADALWCYEKSLEVRPHNNAANFHKARLL